MYKVVIYFFCQPSFMIKSNHVTTSRVVEKSIFEDLVVISLLTYTIKCIKKYYNNNNIISSTHVYIAIVHTCTPVHPHAFYKTL